MSLKCSVGGRDSESFVTVAGADAFIGEEQTYDATEWDGLSTAQKETRLKLAAQLMGYLPLKGRTVYCGQALCFPRSSQSNVTVIPSKVKEAQSYIAVSVVHRALAARSSAVDGLDENSRVTQVSLAGLLSVSLGKEGASAGNVLDRIGRSAQFRVYLLLKSYLSQIRGGSVKETDDDDYPECSTTTTTSTTSSSTTTSTSSTTSTTG